MIVRLVHNISTCIVTQSLSISIWTFYRCLEKMQHCHLLLICILFDDAMACERSFNRLSSDKCIDFRYLFLWLWYLTLKLCRSKRNTIYFPKLDYRYFPQVICIFIKWKLLLQSIKILIILQIDEFLCRFILKVRPTLKD